MMLAHSRRLRRWPMLVCAAGCLVLTWASLVEPGGPGVVAREVWAIGCALTGLWTLLDWWRPVTMWRMLALGSYVVIGAARSSAYLLTGELYPLGAWMIVGGLVGVVVIARTDPR